VAPDQKKAEREGRIIVWIDEAGFYLLAGQVRTYAPRGQTPVLRVPLTREHLSVISGLTLQGRLLVQMQPRAYTGADVVEFLRYLLHHIPVGVVVIWDGASIHVNQEVQRFVAGVGRDRLEVIQLPGYAPELNPQEGIWHHLKQIELGNVSCHTPAELREQLQAAIRRLRRHPDVICGYIKEAGY
jgi:transposase